MTERTNDRSLKAAGIFTAVLFAGIIIILISYPRPEPGDPQAETKAWVKENIIEPNEREMEEIRKRDEEAARFDVLIHVSEEGELSVKGEQTDLDHIIEVLGAAGLSNNKKIGIEADPRTPYKHVQALYFKLKDHGYEITFIVSERR